MKNLGKIVAFLAICSTGLCCNNGWTEFNGTCYTVPHHTYDIQLARQYCVLAGGHLAHAYGNNYTFFFNTLENYNGAEEYWVENGSWTDDTDTNVTDTLCPYVKHLTVKFEFCKEKKNFICEMKANESVCPSGFDNIGERCYRAVTHPDNYIDASRYCVLQRGRLAMLDSEEKEWEAKAAIIGKNETFFVDAKFDGNTTNWPNGKAFSSFIEVSDPTENGTRVAGDCIGLMSNPEYPTEFLWSYIHCEDQKSSYLCEAKHLEETTTTESTLPPTTMASLECPHGYNWKPHEDSGNCFWETTYETQRLNWFQARKFCQMYGGDLATYENEDQETAGLGGARGHYKGLWIGLERDEHDVFHWVDGTNMTFINWDYMQPKLTSKTKFCVTHGAGSVKWQLDYCGVKRWFICKAPKQKRPSMPVIPQDKKKQCDVKGVSAYRNQWYEYEDHCYMVHESGKYTWDTARIFCQDNGAHIASVHSFEETNFILSIMGLFPESNFWIGLSAHGPLSSYIWTDNTPVEFIYWTDEKREAEGLNTCVTFDKRDGSWDNEHCNRLQGVICKRGVKSTYDFTTTEPTTVMPGNCEDGWYNYGNKCYKIFATHWSQKQDWKAAMQGCNAIGAALVSVHGQNEQDFLTDIVLEAGMDVWIGLKSTDGGSIFHWGDGSRIDYTNWNANEPVYSTVPDLFDHLEHLDELYLSIRTNDLCVIMENDAIAIGKWNDINCSDKKGYVCQKMKDPTLTGPYEDPFQCSNITGWFRLGSSCYGFFERQELTWLDAQAECKMYGANLISYRNAAVATFVKRKLKRNDTSFWIGARETKPDKYEYVTGTPLFYADWMGGQPRAASSVLDNCVATNSNGGWMVKSCKEKHPFICKFSTEVEPEEPKVDTLSQTCSDASGDWYDYGGDYCYLFMLSTRKTWGGAVHYCFQHGGHLASFHSYEQIQLIQKLSQEELNDFNTYRRNAIHIGLGKKMDGSFSWIDGSAVDYTNWGEDEPQNEEYECVEMSLLDGKWSETDCEEAFRGFICSVPKRRFPDENLTQDSLVDKESESLSRKLTVGGIIGIFICVVVVLAIIGMTLYYLIPRKQVQPKLLESEPL